MSEVKKIQGLDWDIGSWPARMRTASIPVLAYMLRGAWNLIFARNALTLHALFTWRVQNASASR